MRRLALAAVALLLACQVQAGTPRIIAHRGHTDPTQVENSLRRMKLTAAAGYGVELDLRQARDGGLYVLHDDTLDRSTDGHGAIAAQDGASLARVHLRAPDGQVTDEPLPRYADVAAWAASAPGTWLMLDLKGATAAQVLPALRAQGLESRAILLTFDRVQAAEALRDGGAARVSVLVTSPEDVAYYHALAGGRPLAMYVPQHAAVALFQAAHASGAQVISDALDGPGGPALDALAAADGGQAYRRFLAERPVDVLVSNTPGRVAQALASAAAP